MIEAILIVLVLLWLLGFVNIPLLNAVIIGNLTLFNILIIALIAYLIFSIAPGILRAILGIALLIYILAALGIIAVGGLTNIVVLAVVVALVLYVFGFRF